MVIIDGPLYLFENLAIGEKNVLLSGIAESMEAARVEEKRYNIDILVRALSIMLCHNELAIV